MEVLYICACGSSDPTRASIPWHLAVNGSTEAGQTARIVLAGDAAELVKAAAHEHLAGLGPAPLRDLVANALDRSGEEAPWRDQEDLPETPAAAAFKVMPVSSARRRRSNSDYSA